MNRLNPGECRICDAAHNDPLDLVSDQENDIHESEHVPPSTAHYLRSTGRVVRLTNGNRWVNREDPIPAMWDAMCDEARVRVEPASGHLTTCDPGQYDSDCPVCVTAMAAADCFAPDDPSPYCDHGISLCEDCTECRGTADARVPAESVTDEAYRLVMGDRQSDYNHPSDDFTATGRQWGAVLTNWLHSEGYELRCLCDGGPGHEEDVPDVPPRIVALMMAQLKLSRESHKPKRDNRVDAIGYVLCADRIVEGY